MVKFNIASNLLILGITFCMFQLSFSELDEAAFDECVAALRSDGFNVEEHRPSQIDRIFILHKLTSVNLSDIGHKYVAKFQINMDRLNRMLRERKDDSMGNITNEDLKSLSSYAMTPKAYCYDEHDPTPLTQRINPHDFHEL